MREQLSGRLAATQSQPTTPGNTKENLTLAPMHISFQVSGYSSSVFEDECWVELHTIYRKVFVYMSHSANGFVKGI